jgi:hypothetical protein
MKREDIEKLLGGHAAGTLTAVEREALFAAALQDQQLFEALAREEPLRELLQDPAARGQLLATLAEAPEPWYYRRVHPALIFAATAVIVLGVVVIKFWPERQAAPLSVVATAPRPQPEKSPLPSDLRPFITPGYISQSRKPPATLPAEEPPVLAQAVLPPPPPAAVAPSVPPPPAALTDATGAQSPGQAGGEPRNQGARDEALETVRAQSKAESAAAVPVPPPPAPARALAPAFQVVEARPSVNFGLRYTVLKKQPGGTFAEVAPQQELDRTDEVVIRLQSNDTGYLYVLQRDVQGRWQPFASGRIQPSVPYTIPSSGSLRANSSGAKEFFVTFSRLPLSPTTRALAVPSQSGRQQAGQAGANAGPTTNVVTNVAEPPGQQVAFPITLKYK